MPFDIWGNWYESKAPGGGTAPAAAPGQPGTGGLFSGMDDFASALVPAAPGATGNVVPGGAFGIPDGQLYNVPVDVLNAVRPWVQLPMEQQFAAQQAALDRAQQSSIAGMQASASQSAASTSAAAQIQSAKIASDSRLREAAMQMRSAKELALITTGSDKEIAILRERAATERFNAEMAMNARIKNTEIAMQLGTMFSSGGIRDTAGAIFASHGLGSIPGVGSALAGTGLLGPQGQFQGWVNAPSVGMPGMGTLGGGTIQGGTATPIGGTPPPVAPAPVPAPPPTGNYDQDDLLQAERRAQREPSYMARPDLANSFPGAAWERDELGNSMGMIPSQSTPDVFALGRGYPGMGAVSNYTLSGLSGAPVQTWNQTTLGPQDDVGYYYGNAVNNPAYNYSSTNQALTQGRDAQGNLYTLPGYAKGTPGSGVGYIVGEGTDGSGLQRGTAEVIDIDPKTGRVKEIIPIAGGAASGLNLLGGNLFGNEPSAAMKTLFGDKAGSLYNLGGLSKLPSDFIGLPRATGTASTPTGQTASTAGGYVAPGAAPLPASTSTTGGTTGATTGATSPVTTPLGSVGGLTGGQTPFSFPGAVGYQRPSLDQLPVLEALRSGGRVPVPGNYTGDLTIPEIGVTTPFATPRRGASTFMRADPYSQRQMMDMWAMATGLTPEALMAQIMPFVPGFRYNRRQAMQLA